MTPADLLAHLTTIGCALRVESATLHVSPRHLLTPDLRAAISTHKLALIALLTAPVETGYGQYHSAVLAADFWVCETEADVAALRAEGEVGYLTEEIWHLQALKAQDPETFPDKLRMIHEAKALFDGTIEGVEHGTGDAEPAPDDVPAPL